MNKTITIGLTALGLACSSSLFAAGTGAHDHHKVDANIDANVDANIDDALIERVLVEMNVAEKSGHAAHKTTASHHDDHAGHKMEAVKMDADQHKSHAGHKMAAVKMDAADHKEHAGKAMADMKMDAGHHHHAAMDVSSLANPPAVGLKIHKDTASGWNVEVVTSNFRFAPEHVNTAPQDGEGHAHLYVNGEKTRIYSNWVHLAKLPAGKNEVRVTLNANNHSELSIGDKKVAATETIEVK